MLSRKSTLLCRALDQLTKTRNLPAQTDRPTARSLHGSATGRVPVTGSATGRVPVTGSVTGRVPVTGSVTGRMPGGCVRCLSVDEEGVAAPFEDVEEEEER